MLAIVRRNVIRNHCLVRRAVASRCMRFKFLIKDIQSFKSHITSFSITQAVPRNPSKFKTLWNICNMLVSYDGELLSTRPTPKLEDHPLLAVCDCLFSIFTTTLHMWRPSPQSATWGCTMPWWQEAHFTWFQRSKGYLKLSAQFSVILQVLMAMIKPYCSHV
jgi:hypothetical protein